MSKFKEGDRVRVTSPRCRLRGMTGVLTADSDGIWRVVTGDGNGCSDSDLEHYGLELAEPVSENPFKYGDELVDADGDECRVLAVVDDMVFLSQDNRFYIADSYYHYKEVPIMGYKVKPTEDKPVEMTVEEVGKKLGIDNLKIVKG